MENLISRIRIRYQFDPGTLIDAVLLTTYGCYFERLAERTAKLMDYIGKTRDPGITNLTELDILVIYGNCRIENIMFILPALSYAHNIIGISILNGRMTVALHNMVENQVLDKIM